MADVFISYDERNAKQIARQISDVLEKAGVSCWYAGRDMKEGELRGVVTEAIENCRVFLLICNESALQSAYVQSEITLAVRGFDDGKDRQFVAFGTDDHDVSAHPRMGELLEDFQIVDGCPPDAQHMARLVPLVRTPRTVSVFALRANLKSMCKTLPQSTSSTCANKKLYSKTETRHFAIKKGHKNNGALKKRPAKRHKALENPVSKTQE